MIKTLIRLIRASPFSLRRRYLFGILLGFLGVLLDSSSIFFISSSLSNNESVRAFNIFGYNYQNSNYVFLLLGGVFAILSSIVRGLTYSFNEFSSAKIGNYIASKSLRYSLLNANSSYNTQEDSILGLLANKISLVSLYAFYSQQLLLSFVNLSFISILILITGKKGVLIIALLASSSYLVTAYFTRNRFVHVSKSIKENMNSMMFYSGKYLVGRDELLIYKGIEKAVSKYKKFDQIFRFQNSIASILSYLPKVAIEIIIGAIFVLLAISRLIEINIITISEISLLIVGAQRMLPLVQQVYQYWSGITINSNVTNEVLDLFLIPNPKKILLDNSKNEDWEKLSILNIDKNTKNKFDENLLSEIVIKKGQKILLTGESGRGKTTILKSIAGLKFGSPYKVIIDSKPLYEDDNFLNLWRNQIAYIPQFPVGFDDDIVQNIIFSHDKDISLETVKYFAKLTFINHLLLDNNSIDNVTNSKSIFTKVRQYSGGERQRISITRALVSNRPTIIMDEPTSSLDRDMSVKLISNLLNDKVMKDYTIIVVSHDKEIMGLFDEIFYI